MDNKSEKSYAKTMPYSHNFIPHGTNINVILTFAMNLFITECWHPAETYRLWDPLYFHTINAFVSFALVFSILVFLLRCSPSAFACEYILSIYHKWRWFQTEHSKLDWT